MSRYMDEHLDFTEVEFWALYRLGDKYPSYLTYDYETGLYYWGVDPARAHKFASRDAAGRAMTTDEVKEANGNGASKVRMIPVKVNIKVEVQK